MNEDKLKELEENAENNRLERRVLVDPIIVIDLIKYVRQLEKDKEKLEVLQDIDADTINNYAEAVAKFKESIAELLAALKEIEFQAKGVTLSSDSKYQSEVAQCIENNATKFTTSIRENRMKSFQKAIREVINHYSMENGSNTPDMILAEYLEKSLLLFDEMVNRRTGWYRAEQTKDRSCPPKA